MNAVNNRAQSVGGASKVIGCRRMPGEYQFYDLVRGSLIARVCVCEQADDQTNSRLRDSIQSAIYYYGKGLNLWP